MPTLVDPWGRPVSTKALARPQVQRRPSASTPAFGADPDRLVSLFKKADDGDPRELQQLLAEVEARDGHFGGVLETRRRALTRLAWRAVAKTDDVAEVEIAEAVQRDILDAPWFKPLVRSMLDALVKGWSVCSITWATGDVWKPSEVRWVDPVMTAVDPADDQRLMWRVPKAETQLEAIEPYTAVVHAASDPSGPLYRRGLGRALAILYSAKRLGFQCWQTFVELYGVARPVATYTDALTDDELGKLQADLDGWQHAGWLTKPHGVTLDFPEPTRDSTGTPPHESLARWCDEQASKRIVGQTLTSDSGQNGSRALGAVHERVAEVIVEGDAGDIAATVMRDLVEPYVRLNYGMDAPLPTIGALLEAGGQKAFQLEVMKAMLPFGLEVEQSVVRDLAGLPEPAPGASILRSKAAGVQAGAATSAASKVAKRRREEWRARYPGSAVGKLAAEPDAEDIIDRDGGTAAGEAWRPDMQPFVDAVAAAGDKSTSFEDFLGKLAGETEVDASEYTRNLAEWTVRARGLGDGTDKVT